jgi:hypothetical protein
MSKVLILIGAAIISFLQFAYCALMNIKLTLMISGIAVLEQVQCFTFAPLRLSPASAAISQKRWASGNIAIGRSNLFGLYFRLGNMDRPCRTTEVSKWQMADQAMIRRLENTAMQFDELTNQLADPEVMTKDGIFCSAWEVAGCG